MTAPYIGGGSAGSTQPTSTSGQVVTQGITLLSKLNFSNLTTNQLDPARFQEAAKWYVAAINGDKDALCKLFYMSGRNGCETCGFYGYSCGHATDEAKAYDWALYLQAKAVIDGRIPASTPIPEPGQPGLNTLGTIGNVAATTSDVSGQIATQLGQPTTQLGSPAETRAKLQTIGVVIAAVVVVGLVIYFARR